MTMKAAILVGVAASALAEDTNPMEKVIPMMSDLETKIIKWS